ncbi:hypothetical protein [Streptomyces sp. NPDC002676]
MTLPAEADEVYHCADGSGGGGAGIAHFLFVIPGRRVDSYFQSTGIKPVPGYDTRKGFEDVARLAGRDVSKVKRYEAGSVSRDGFSYNVFVDEDAPGSAAVYVEVVSSG